MNSDHGTPHRGSPKPQVQWNTAVTAPEGRKEMAPSIDAGWRDAGKSLTVRAFLFSKHQ
jgi:hypothetical protein